jgi:hypothetical protein
MTHHIDNRQKRPHTAKMVFEVAGHCQKNGIDKSEERKVTQLLGRFASRHELEVNVPSRKPKFR